MEEMSPLVGPLEGRCRLPGEWTALTAADDEAGEPPGLLTPYLRDPPPSEDGGAIRPPVDRCSVARSPTPMPRRSQNSAPARPCGAIRCPCALKNQEASAAVPSLSVIQAVIQVLASLRPLLRRLGGWRWILAAILPGLIAACSSAPAASTAAPVLAAPQIPALVPGVPLEREVAAGATDALEVRLAAGTYLELAVDQSGLDVAVSLVGVPPSPGVGGRVLWRSADRSGILLARGLPKAPTGKKYALWAIAENGPTPGGLFTVDELHRVRFRLPADAPVPVSPFREFAVTLEPAVGGPQPTGPMLLRGVLGSTDPTRPPAAPL